MDAMESGSIRVHLQKRTGKNGITKDRRT